MSPKLEFRNYMLGTTMHGKWETVTQISRGVRKKYGNAYHPTDARAILRDLGKLDGYRIEKRKGGADDDMEYRLFVRQSHVQMSKRRSAGERSAGD